MKFKKLIILIIFSLALVFAAAGLSGCELIDKILGNEPPACAHEYGEWEEGVNTCTEHTQIRICSLCGETDTQPLTPRGHSYGEWEDTANTCTEHTQKRVCAECKEEETQSLAPKGHNYDGEWQEETNTCTKHVKILPCKDCGIILQSMEYFPPKGHTYGEWQDVTNTCTEHTQKRVCAECKEEETQSLTPKGHTVGEWQDVTNSCTEHTQKNVCIDCSKEFTRTLTPKGHSYGAWEMITNTCAAQTKKRVCSACSNEEIQTSSTEHGFGEWQDKINTCTQHTQTRVCGVCGVEETRSTAPDGHRYVGGRCETCKELFYDGDASVLDKYNGDYGYNYFKSRNLAAQATLYENIDNAVRAFHLNGTDAQTLTQNNKAFHIAAEINYSDLGLTSDEAISVWKIFKDDNPLYYWLSGEVAYTTEALSLLTVEDYIDGETRLQTNDFIYNKVTEYSLMLDLSDNAYRKALAFHDKIISTIDYAYDENGVPQSAAWAHNIIGVFEERGAVCEGYAKTFQILLNYNGVENVIVSGRGNSEDHAWNLVKLGDNNWYWCDLTWDDTPSWEWGISYYYFMVNDTQQVNWRDGGWRATQVQNFLSAHTPDVPTSTNKYFLYELPARATGTYTDNKFPVIRQTFTVGDMTFAVTGYNTVQLIKCEQSGAVTIPETVEYGGVTYTVISIGGMSDGGLFGDIAKYTFDTFCGVTNVSVPKTVKFIWEHAVYCQTIKEITVDSQNEWFCSVDGVLFTKSMKTLLSYPSAREASEYRIPDQVTQIAYDAFTLTANLERLHIGKNFTMNGGIMCAGVYQDNSRNISLGMWRSVVYGFKLTANTAITVDAENPVYSADENWLYNKSGTYAYCYFNRNAENIYIPSNLTNMDSNIFINYSHLKAITAAEDNTAYTSVGGVLYNKAVTKIIFIPLKLEGSYTLPDTITEIGNLDSRDMDVTFTTKHKLTELNLSVTLKLLGKECIFWCSSLTRINYGGTVAQWLAIEKAEDWFTPLNNQTPPLIYCTDGVLDVHGKINQ